LTALFLKNRGGDLSARVSASFIGLTTEITGLNRLKTDPQILLNF
jgi:hypothetical protein